MAVKIRDQYTYKFRFTHDIVLFSEKSSELQSRYCRVLCLFVVNDCKFI